MIVSLAPEAIEQYLKLETAGENTDGIDELLAVLDRTLPFQIGDSAPDEFRLGRFAVHRLRGVLSGWWSADTGAMRNGRTLVAVFYAEGHKAGVVSVGEHDEAYRGAKFRRAALAPNPARRRAILRRIR